MHSMDLFLPALETALTTVAILAAVVSVASLRRRGVEVPGYQTRAVMCPYPVEDVAIVLDAILDEWRRGRMLQLQTARTTISKLTIEFSPTAMFVSGARATGFLFDPPYAVRVAISGRLGLHETSLVEAVVAACVHHATKRPSAPQDPLARAGLISAGEIDRLIEAVRRRQ